MFTPIKANLCTVTNVVTLEMVRKAYASDAVQQSLHRTIQDRFPANFSQLEPQLRQYYRSASNLSSIDSVIINGGRYFMPRTLHKDILHALPAAHYYVSAICTRAAV